MTPGPLFRVCAALIGYLLLVTARSQVPAPDTAAKPAMSNAGPAPAPALAFASTVASEELYDALKRFPVFASLDKEKLGSPIVIRVSLEFGRMSTPSNVASAVLTIGTLGLLPAVSNRDLLITYEVLVNSTVLSSYSYSKRVMRVFNMYSTDRTHGLGDDGLAWVMGTAAQFADDLRRDPRYAELQSEYHYYYDSPSPAHH